MRRRAALLCGALALGCLWPASAQDSGFYVGVESRQQKAALDVETAEERDGVTGVVDDYEPYINDAVGTNSITAIRVGYIAEVASGVGIDASLAFGRNTPTYAINSMYAPGVTGVDTGGHFDPASYIDFGVGVRGTAGAISYTGGLRYEKTSIEEDTVEWPGGRETTETTLRNIVLEGTVGGGGEGVRYYGGLALQLLDGETIITDSDDGDTMTFEYSFDMPLTIFVGLEASSDRTRAFARLSLVGETLLSSVWAGIAIKF